ncbi:MAG: lectin like domain-containing protein, partial [Candidatus Omnitrophica bacterium]|nr:lectin like domain-containing protein [Candidatus Omnitrophota bacterium]
FPFARNKASSPTQDKTPSLPQVENPIFSPEISVDENGNGIMTAPDGKKKIIFVKAPYIPKIIMTEEQKKINADNLRLFNKKNYGLLISPPKKTADTFKSVESNNISLQIAFPIRFDLREHGWVTPAKNQGPCGSCVVFATIGAVESNLLMKHGISMDLSENHLKNVIGLGPTHCDGSSAPLAVGYMAGWVGPVSEQDDPYNNAMSPVSPPGLQPRLHIQNVYVVHKRNPGENSNDLKSAIMNYGGGTTDGIIDYGCFNNNTLSPYYYCSSHSSWDANHALTIVGWDDSISRYNFIDSYGNMPAVDGAFIVKNSWGTTVNDNGFLYISYADPVLGRAGDGLTYFYDTDYIPGPLPVYYGSPFTENNQYHYNNSWDLSGWGYARPKIGYKWGRVTYTAKRNEKITAIGFGFGTMTNSPQQWLLGLNHYEVYIYTNSNYQAFSNGQAPLAETLVARASGTVYVGYVIDEYRTIRFSKPIHVRKGQNFSIALKMWADGYGQNNGQVPIDKALSKGGAPISKSFFSQDGVNWVSGQDWLNIGPYYHPLELGVTVFTHSDSVIKKNASMSAR